MIGITLILSFITAFKYGRSCVLEKGISSSSEGKAFTISEVRLLSVAGLLRSRSRVKVAVRLVVSLPAILFEFQSAQAG